MHSEEGVMQVASGGINFPRTNEIILRGEGSIGVRKNYGEETHVARGGRNFQRRNDVIFMGKIHRR